MRPAAIVRLPVEYRQSSDVVDVKHEEEALCWLWAFPSLLPWHGRITWLYTPVVGRTRWPGDLWGIDDRGELLIIEAKHCFRDDDPFTDFVEYHQDGRVELSAAHWETKWANHHSAEVSFPNGIDERPKGQTDGILPRSNRRSHIRRWPELAAIIDRNIRSPAYRRHVISNLKTRANRGDPAPFYCAVIIEPCRVNTILTRAAIRSARRLQLAVGPTHVSAIAILCRRTMQEQARILVRTIHLP